MSLLFKKTKDIYSRINEISPSMGELKKIAKTIKKDHVIGSELWSTQDYYARLLAILIIDQKYLTQDFIETIIQDIQIHTPAQRNQI